MKGRKPKDLSFKLLTGNAGKRSLDKNSSAPFVAEPFEKPDGLDDHASKEWDRIVTTLAPILSPASAGMVLIACDAYSEWRRACELIAREGESYQTTSREGQEFHRLRPEVAMRQNARRAYFQALAELGASPVAHTRVNKLPDNNQTELEGIAKFFT